MRVVAPDGSIAFFEMKDGRLIFSTRPWGFSRAPCPGTWHGIREDSFEDTRSQRDGFSVPTLRRRSHGMPESRNCDESRIRYRHSSESCIPAHSFDSSSEIEALCVT
jgi:hypothetical protein